MASTRKLRGGRSRRSGGPAYSDLPRRQQRMVAAIIEKQYLEVTGKPASRPVTSQVFRFRFHLVPFCWLGAGLAGLACRAGHLYLAGVISALVVVAATVAGSRGARVFPRRWNQAMAFWAMGWALALMWWGTGWWDLAGLAGWAGGASWWGERYRWTPEAEPPVPDTSVEDIWAELCGEQKWAARLGPAQRIPNGRQWEIICHGAKTHIGKITTARDAVAAAFDKSIVEAYTEPARSGKRSRGTLTILEQGTLEEARRWAGATIDPKTGLAVVGRFPEGGDLTQRWFVPGVGGGIKHTIIAGCDGSGKTGLLDLTLAISAASGMVASVILDPQEGQALPAWQDRLLYAKGAEECLTRLRGLHASMYDRSKDLAALEWVHPEDGRTYKGFGFYDYELVKAARAAVGLPPLPIIEIVIDEAPVLLALKGVPELLLDIAKLGRKVGYRVVLAAQVPSLSELAKGELRSILEGGNVYCFRTGDKLSAGMAGIPANPNELPMVWSDGVTPTVGLGFAKTVEMRPTVTMRTDWLANAYDAAERYPGCGLNAEVAERLASSVRVTAEDKAAMAALAADASAQQQFLLGLVSGEPQTLGQLISAANGRLSASQVVDAVAELEGKAQVRKAGGLIEAAKA